MDLLLNTLLITDNDIKVQLLESKLLIILGNWLKHFINIDRPLIITKILQICENLVVTREQIHEAKELKGLIKSYYSDENSQYKNLASSIKTKWNKIAKESKEVKDKNDDNNPNKRKIEDNNTNNEIKNNDQNKRIKISNNNNNNIQSLPIEKVEQVEQILQQEIKQQPPPPPPQQQQPSSIPPHLVIPPNIDININQQLQQIEKQETPKKKTKKNVQWADQLEETFEFYTENSLHQTVKKNKNTDISKKERQNEGTIRKEYIYIYLYNIVLLHILSLFLLHLFHILQ